MQVKNIHWKTGKKKQMQSLHFVFVLKKGSFYLHHLNFLLSPRQENILREIANVQPVRSV